MCRSIFSQYDMRKNVIFSKYTDFDEIPDVLSNENFCKIFWNHDTLSFNIIKPINNNLILISYIWIK